LDDRLKELLKQLGDAINESITASSSVNQRIQKIRDEGYNLYVFLDATIGLGKNGEKLLPAPRKIAQLPAPEGTEIQFRINFEDLTFLRALGIDPTRKVKSSKRGDPNRSNTPA
jgi:hypothetical protein